MSNESIEYKITCVARGHIKFQSKSKSRYNGIGVIVSLPNSLYYFAMQPNKTEVSKIRKRKRYHVVNKMKNIRWKYKA